MADPRKEVFTIADTASMSNSIDLEYLNLCALEIPVLAAGTTNLGVYASFDDSTYAKLVDRDGDDVTIPVSDELIRVQLEPGLFSGLRYVKLQAQDDTPAAVVQDDDYVIKPAIRQFG